MSSSIEITPELMAGFMDEAPEYLEMLDAGLMELEAQAGTGVLTLETPDDIERMTVMFRAAHSLKGLAAAFGFDNIKNLTHLMETLFDQVRMKKRDLSADSFEVLFSVFDRLKALVQELTDEEADPVKIDDVLKALNGILDSPSGESESTASPATGEALTEAEASVLAEIGLEMETTATNTEVASQAPTAQAPLTPAELPEPASAETLAKNEIFSDAELSSLFLETTTDALDELGQGLLKLEEAPGDRELLNLIFRSAHNIKGASGAAGMVGMNRLTHDMETVFDQMRQDKLTLDESLTNALLQGIDYIRGSLEQIRAGNVQDVNITLCHDLFDRWTALPIPIEEGAVELSATTPAAEPVVFSPPIAPTVAEDPSPQGETESPNLSESSESPPAGVYLEEDQIAVYVSFGPGNEESAIQTYLIFNKLGELGTVISSTPDIDSIAGDTCLDDVVFVLEAVGAPDDIEKIIKCYNVQSVKVVSGQEQSSVEPPVSETTCSPTAEKTPTEATSTAPPTSKAATAPLPQTETPTTKQATPATPASPSPAAQEVKSGPKNGTPAKGGDKRQGDSAARKPGETLRVDQERLDDLMNLGGELIINRARFGQIHRSFKQVFTGKSVSYLVDDITDILGSMSDGLNQIQTSSTRAPNVEELSNQLLQLGENFGTIRSLVERVHEVRTSMHDFDEAMHALTRVSDAIQKGIMSTRLVSIGPLFTRFRRVVRDISKSTGKQVELVLRGEQTELDKRMIDELGDPLTHMVRNSVDHGIETPEERVKAGKKAEGTITLEAIHRGNSICIEVVDDGAGINIERVKDKIIERELATEAQVEKMSHRELYQYVLKPGFSTAEVVTDLSGRGMGMDIVVSKIERINGTIEIDSTPGKGTKVTIKLPLTMAILTSIITRIGEGIYAIPLEAVAEIITVRKKDLQSVNRKQVVRIRDRVVPVAVFEDIFCTRLDSLQTKSVDKEEFQLVIVGFDDDQIGLVVDEMLGQEDVVIKSLADNYRNVRGIAGASIRGDGTVSLILDIGTMMEMNESMVDGASTPSSLEAATTRA